jgi:NAD(P)-dependent dehydrogenase (short-subunit alcohol dehydrogenase family)
VEQLEGKTAVITGGGSGIGLGLVRALVERGMNVVVADIEEDMARQVAASAAAAGVRATPVRCDVSDFGSVTALAERAFAEFGSVEVLCNNAGVFIMGPIEGMIPEDWSWVFSVNVMGVVNGVHAFLPRLLDQGAPAHIVNTASVASLGGGDVYGASKAAVLAISESLHSELAERNIGVTALLPANINSSILGAQRNRPDTFGRRAPEPLGTGVTSAGLDPIHVGRRAVAAIQSGELYCFVFPRGWEGRLRSRSEQRFSALLGALDRGGVEAENAP